VSSSGPSGLARTRNRVPSTSGVFTRPSSRTAPSSRNPASRWVLSHSGRCDESPQRQRHACRAAAWRRTQPVPDVAAHADRAVARATTVFTAGPARARLRPRSKWSAPRAARHGASDRVGRGLRQVHPRPPPRLEHRGQVHDARGGVRSACATT
jgi:hypothetical protein